MPLRKEHFEITHELLAEINQQAEKSKKFIESQYEDDEDDEFKMSHTAYIDVTFRFVGFTREVIVGNSSEYETEPFGRTNLLD